MMAGQAGWYRAPGEEGLLRYWNGLSWTEHRQPVPVPETVNAPTNEPEPVPAHEAELDSEPAATVQPEPLIEPVSDRTMENFERQFDSYQSAFPALHPETEPEPLIDFAPVFSAQPLDADAAAPEDGGYAPQPVSAALRFAAPPISPVTASIPVAPADRWNADAAERLAPDAAPAAAVDPVSAAELAPDRSRRRRLLVGAVRGMLAGLAVILIGAALMFFLGQQSQAAAGQSQTLGIITAVGSSGASCSPTARFASGVHSYTAGTGAPVTPCQFQLGQSVTVVYSANDPKNTGRIVVPDLVQQYSWTVPVLGVVIIFVSVLVFILGAGSIVDGVAIMREGRKSARRGEPVKRRRTADAPESAR